MWFWIVLFVCCSVYFFISVLLAKIASSKLTLFSYPLESCQDLGQRGDCPSPLGVYTDAQVLWYLQVWDLIFPISGIWFSYFLCKCEIVGVWIEFWFGRLPRSASLYSRHLILCKDREWKEALAGPLLHSLASSVWLLHSINMISPEFQIWWSNDVFIFITVEIIHENQRLWRQKFCS